MILGRLEPPPASPRGVRGSGDPLVDRYLTQLREALEQWPSPPAAVTEILNEIADHLAESRRQGRPLSEVLRGLGPADELAQAYGAALLLEPAQRAEPGWRPRLPRAIRFGLLRASTLGLLVLLALASSALCGLGVLGLLAALILPMVPPEVLEPTLRAGLPQLVVMAVSGLTLGLGAQACRWLHVNVRLARSTLWRGRVLERGQDASAPPGARLYPAPVDDPSASKREPRAAEGARARISRPRSKGRGQA